MSERGEAFDRAREVHEAAQKNLRDLIDSPTKGVPMYVYRVQIDKARRAQQRAHKAMMAAWA